MAESEATLKKLFFDAQYIQDDLESLDPRSEEFKDAQRSAVKALEGCKEFVEKLALYSKNEEIDDISTGDLQFLTVDYLLAELLLKAYDTDRLAQIRRAAELFESFLTRLDSYDVLSRPDQKLLERYQENRPSFAIVTSSNPEDRRNAKVARFQEEKALKEKLKTLRAKSSANHVDDEVLRSLYVAELSLFVHQSFQSLDLISQEISMLSRMPQVDMSRNTTQQDVRQRNQDRDGYSSRLDGPLTLGGLGRPGGPLLDSKGKPLQPFTLTDKRTQLQQGVFRPGHSLPTMSIDEYLEEEKRRGGIIDGGGNANAPQVEADEDNLEQVDAATYKAREWDEFVEANPKGAGNTINRG